jgi:hypothetical protein
MIAVCRQHTIMRIPVGIFLIILPLATPVPAQTPCTEKTLSEFATATSRETAERNATAKLAQRLKKLGGKVSRPTGPPQIECKHPLMWHCTASVKACI